jgi:hypothetical protein
MAGLLISVDVEASGPCPNHGDMISFGCVVIEPTFSWQFYSDIMLPECEKFKPAAYHSIGMSRDAHYRLAYSHITAAMKRFESWCNELKIASGADRLIMVSDNPGFDFQWINFECFNKLGYNPFGHTARRINDVWGGLRNRYYETQGWKKLRKTAHTHNALDDALGNAEAWLAMWELYGSKEAKKEIEKLREKFQQISESHSSSSRETNSLSDCTTIDCRLGNNRSLIRF